MRKFALCIAILIMVLSACTSADDTTIKPATDQPSVSLVRSSATAMVMPQQTLTPPVVSESTVPPVIPTSTSLPLPTLAEEVVHTEDCMFASKFIGDITIPDGSVLGLGQVTEKIWRLHNSGTCPWDTGTALIHIKGSTFNAPRAIEVPLTLPGQDVDVHLMFTTSSVPGTYESYWRLQSPHGVPFGGMLFIRFQTSSTAQAVVPATPSPTQHPTQTPTATATNIPIATATALPPTLTPIPGCGTYDEYFKGVLSQASMLRLDVGCALGLTTQATGVVQEYWANVEGQNAHQRFRSLLLKNDATDTLYALVGKDTLTYEADVVVYENLSALGSPGSTCDAPSPPDGYLTPQNTFAALWCAEKYWKLVGWPRQNEITANLVIQRTERGVLIHASMLPNMTYSLALDLLTGQGTVQMGP